MNPLIVSARLNDVDPRAWLADVLARIADHPRMAVSTRRSMARLTSWPIRMVLPLGNVTSIRQSGLCRFDDARAGSLAVGGPSMGSPITRTGRKAGVE